MNKHGSSGLTLVEILVTLIIIGILASIAIPSYQSFTQKQVLTFFTDELKRLTLTAKTETVTKNQTIQLSFQHLIQDQYNSHHDWQIQTKNLETEQILGEMNQSLFDGIQVMYLSSSSVIRFDTLNGKPKQEIQFQYQIKDQDNEIIGFHMSQRTGKIKVCSKKGILYEAC